MYGRRSSTEASFRAALVNLAINARDAMPDGGKLTFATRQYHIGRSRGRGRRRRTCRRLCRDRGRATPAPAFRSPSSSGFSIHSSPPRRSAGEPGSGSAWCSDSPSSRAAASRCAAKKAAARCSRIYLPKADGECASADRRRTKRSTGRQGNHPVRRGRPQDPRLCDVQLESLGYKVIPAANAEEALAIVGQGAAFDLLFTDIVMPGSMNGRQLAETMMAGAAVAAGALHFRLQPTGRCRCRDARARAFRC